MTPHDDRHTQRLLASPNQEKPGTIATFLPITRIVHGNPQSLRSVTGEHYGSTKARFCSGGEQSRALTNGYLRIWGHSISFYNGSCGPYWGRRRYGPIRPVFRMA